MIRPAFLVAIALFASCIVSLGSALAGERVALADDQAWELALYVGEDDDGLSGGGVALDVGLEGLPDATLALDYGDGEGWAGEADGLALVAAADLIGGAGDDRGFLQLGYRAAVPTFGLAGADEDMQQIFTLRGRLRW